MFLCLVKCLLFAIALMSGLHILILNDRVSCVPQVCHIVLGLRPSSAAEEGEIVLGWLNRAQSRPLTVGHFWYIVAIDWWQYWADYTLGQVRDSQTMYCFVLCNERLNRRICYCCSLIEWIIVKYYIRAVSPLLVVIKGR